MRTNRKKSGFTLAETLLVVALVLVLAGLAFIAVINYLRGLRQLEFDGTAKEIFVVAQNHLSLAKSQGYLGRAEFGTEEEDDSGNGTGVYYYVVSGNDRSVLGDDSALGLMLPSASIEETARLSGSYVVRYNKEAGIVMDVFFSTKSGTRFGHDYTSGEYDSLISDYRDTETVSKKAERRDYPLDHSVLGYYGGAEASAPASDLKLKAPSLKIVNAETLKVIVTNPNTENLAANGIRLQLKITGKTSGNTKTVTLIGSGGSYYGTSPGSFELVLDDVTTDGGHFAQLLGTDANTTFVGDALIPGEDIEIEAVCFSSTVVTNIATSGKQTTNSLYGDGTDVDGHVAQVANIRHLENLSQAVSDLNKNGNASASVSYSKAEQTTDLSWTDFRTAIDPDHPEDVHITHAADAAASPDGCFDPVNPAAALEYAGGSHRISDVKVNDAGNAGLFGTLGDGSKVSDLALLDFDVTSTANSAGALVGSATDTEISGVIAYNNRGSSEASLEIRGAGASGGLVGTLRGGEISDSAAAVYVSASAGSAGGLLGQAADDEVEISGCYAGGHTQGGRYLSTTTAGAEARVNVIATGGSAGGLVGASTVALDVDHSYSTCSVSGSAASGGLIGTASAGTVNNCYATGQVTGSGTKGALAGVAGSLSGSDNHYFELVTQTLSPTGSGGDSLSASALDDTLTSYQGFVDDSLDPAVSYDALLTMTYQGSYALKTVSQLGGTGSQSFLSAHFGDWPAYETLVKNVKKAGASNISAGSVPEDATLIYGANAGVPEDAEFVAASPAPNSDLYNEYLRLTAEALGRDTMPGDGVKLVNLSLVSEGRTVSPTEKVGVQVKLDAPAADGSVRVIRLGTDSEELKATTEGDVVSFETDSLTAFAIIRSEGVKSAETEPPVLDEDGTLLLLDDEELEAEPAHASPRYRVTLYYDGKAAIPDEAILRAEELPADSAESRAAVEQALKALGLRSDEVRSAVALDISLYDLHTGELLQPAGPVDVQIELLGRKLPANAEISIVHLGEQPEVLTAKADTASVSFSTSGFSVYVVIEHEGDTNVPNPRVEFHFINKDYFTNADSGYESLAAGEFQSAPFRFVNKANELQTTQILKNGEALEMILNPPNREVTVDNGDGTTSVKTQYFFGWYLVDGRIAADGESIIYSWTVDPDEIKVEKPITIDPSENGTVGQNVNWSIDGVEGTAELDEEGTAHVFLAPMYEDYYFISYHLGPKEDTAGLAESLLVRHLVVLGNDEQVTARIGGVTGIAPDAKHQVFSGWETVNAAGQTLTTKHEYRTVDVEGNERNFTTGVSPSYGETANAAGTTGYYAVFRKADFSEDRDIDLYPVFAESRWLYFNTGKSGNGATYVAAAYRVTNEAGTGTYFDSSFFSADRNKTRRIGFEFTGWYVDVNQDANGEISNKDSVKPVTIRIVDNSAVGQTVDPEHGTVLTPGSSITGVSVQNGTDAPVIGSAYSPEDGIIAVTVDLQATKLVDSSGNLAVPNGYEQKVTYTIEGETKTVTLYKVIDGKLYFYKGMDDLTVYADWHEVDDTTVQVNVWRQKVTDDKNAADSEKTYDYVREYSFKANAHSGWTLAELRSNGKLVYNGDNVEALTEKGFHLKGNSTASTTMSTSAVRGDGSTVVNVYYDRDLITFNFNVYGTTEYAETTADTPTEQYALINGEYVRLTRDSGTEVTAWTPQYTYTATTADGTNQYGLVDGEYVGPLTRTEHTNTRVYYTYSTGYGYGATNVEYTGTFYTRSGSYNNYTYTATAYNGNNLPPDNSTTYYGLTGTDYWGNPSYSELTRRTEQTTTYSYTYGSGTDYPGTRYTRATGGDYYTGVRYTKDGTTYTVTVSEDGTQYGVDANGGHVQLAKGTATVYKWYVPEYGDVYTATTATTGELYGKVGEKYYLLTPVYENRYNYTTQYTYTANDTYGTRYGILDGEYVQLTATQIYNNTFSYRRFDTTTNNNGTQYALVDGEYVQLTYGVVGSNTTYTIERQYIYNVSNSTSSNYYYIPLDGSMQQTYLYRNNNRWYRTRTGSYFGGYNYSNPYDGDVYTRSNNNSNGNSYTGQRYKISGSSFVETDDTSGNLYGKSGTSYFVISANTTNVNGWLLNGTEFTGTRYTQSNTNLSYTGQRYTRSGSGVPYTYTATDAETNGLYGVDDRGGHVALTMTATGTGIYNYSYNGQPYTGTRYERGSGASWTGERLLRTGSSAPYTYTVTTEHTGTQYMQDGNTGPDGTHGHVALNRTGPTSTIVGYTYVDANNVTQNYALSETRYTKSYGLTGNNIEYTGIRWVKNTVSNGWHLYKRFTGLYGQTLAQCGYVWPEEYDWYSGYNGSSGTGTRTTFLDAFLPTSLDTTVEFYSNSTGGSNRIYFYKQKLNADGTLSDEYELVNTIITTATAFNLSDKYNGFTCYAWKSGNNGTLTRVGELMNQNGNYYYDANPNQGGYQTASFSSSLHVYFKRNSYSLTFVTQYPGLADLWADGGTPSDDAKTVSGILYEANISSYGPGGANYWVPNVPPHYSFQGWYEDAACTVPFSFNTTMPDGDKIVYAGWRAQRFRVMIDPNGAEIDHINHNWDNASSDLAKKGYTNYWWTGDRWGSDPTAVAKTYSASAYNSSWEPFATFNRVAKYRTDENNNQVLERAADSGYRTDQSTYFNATYNEMVGEYTLTRDFVPMSDAVAEAYANDGGTVYYYINTQARDTDGSSLPSDLRNALYVTEDEIHQYYKFYRDWVQGNLDGGYITGTQILDEETWRYTYVGTQKYRAKYANEHYEFLGWFRVYTDDEGNETGVSAMPYNFSDPVKGPLMLRAYWRLDGGYRILYSPMFTTTDGVLINGELQQWEDPRSSNRNYADNADTEVLQQPTGLTANGEPTNEFIFRGWRLVSMNTDGSFSPLENGVYYQPGEPFTVHADFADKNGVIYMQAVYEPRDSSYRRPHVTNLTLDANGGFLTLDGSNRAGSNFDLSDTWTGEFGTVAGTVLDENNNAVDIIEFGDIQSSEALHLYRYATTLEHEGGNSSKPELDPHGTNYFAHPEGYFLLGFDEDPAEGDYIATYPADSIIGVTRHDDATIYAVWEPMVYLTVVNDTGVGPVTFSLSSADDGALQIVNVANGLYDRKLLSDLGSFTVAEGETARFAVPMGANKHITLKGTNTLGVGYLLSATSELNGTARTLTGALTDDAADFTEVQNTKAFGLTDLLVVDQNGIKITFTAKKNPHTLVLDDHYPGGYTQEIYFSEAADGTVYYQTESETSYELPTTSTRIGYEFLGWDEDPDATTPTYGNDTTWDIADLTAFFTSSGSPAADLEVVTLYAIWKVNTETQIVYVYKEVPAPGSQEKEFSFTVGFSGKYKYSTKFAGSWSDSAEQTIPEHSESFTLVHGQYLKITSTAIVGSDDERSYLQSVVQKFNANGTQVGSDVALRWDWEDWDPQNTNLSNTITFNATSFFVTEDNYSGDHYDTEVNVTGQASGYTLTGSNADRSLTWSDAYAGGTAVFKNIRQTATVTVKKELVGNTTASKIFSFSASYTLTENINGTDVTSSKNFGSFTVASGSSGHPLENIPVGAKLTVTEHGPDLCDYTTTAVWGSETVTPNETDTTSAGVTTYYRIVADRNVANENVDLVFTNTLKSCKVTFYKYDQNGSTGVPSYFRLSNEYGVVAQNLYGYNGQFYTTDVFYAGEYTLEETFTSASYIGLEGPVTLRFTGADGGKLSVETAAGDEAKVLISGNATDGYEVKVYNIRTVNISIAKQMYDAILTTNRIFFFDVSYSYQLNGQTVNVDLSGPDAVEVESGHSVTLKVPVGAAGLTVAEDTLRLANATDTIEQTYDTTVKYNSDTAVSGNAYSYGAAVALGNDGDLITFTNTRKTVNVTVTKKVIADDTSGSFTFTVTVLNGALPIKNFTVYEGTDPGASDDWVTDDSGVVKLPGGADFTLQHGESRVLKIPVGASLTIKEELTSTQAAELAVFICMPGGSENMLSGTSDAFRVLGPTEDKEIRVYNIPSICKVTDGSEKLLYFRDDNGTPSNPADDIYIPAIYGTIHGAFDHINAHALYSKSGTTYTAYSGSYQVQMLVDYEVPNSDVVKVNPGYDITFTTADTDAGDGYPFRRSGAYTGEIPDSVDSSESIGRAVLTRPSSATEAFFTVGSASGAETTFKMSDLILDGGGAALTAKGGALTAYNTKATIEDCVIFKFIAEDGGAVYTEGDSLKVEDTIFDSCMSDKPGNGNGGGAINTTADTLKITGSTFQNCSAVFQGGAVYQHGMLIGGKINDPTVKDKKAELENCSFVSCKSRAGGGAELDVGNVKVTGCEFIRCTSEQMTDQKGTNGGGLNVYTGDFAYGGKLEVSDSSFKGCEAKDNGSNGGHGGGLRSTALTTTLTNCTFENYVNGSNTTPNGALYGGGAAFTNPDGTATVSGCTFTNCEATTRGGGLYSEAASLTVQDNGSTATSITGCSANNGGGLYVKDATTATVQGSSTFTSCTATNGGGVYADGTAKVTLTGSTSVNRCTATSGGGAYVNTSAKLTMSGSAVIDGKGSGSALTNATSGGGVYVAGTLTMAEGSNAAIRNCTSSSNGGAVFVTGSSARVYVNGGMISGNEAKGYGGGAIRVEGGAQVEVSGSAEITGNKLTGNAGRYGGAIGIKNGTVSISGNAEISGNYAQGSGSGNDKPVQGGAIYVDENCVLNISGGTISGNYAKATNASGFAYGGAIYAKSGGVINLSGGTISGNYAQNTSTPANAKGAGIYLAEGSSLNISGNPGFGGADKDENGSFDNDVGNCLGQDPGGTNGGQPYTNIRQDIYIAGYSGNTAASITVDEPLTSATGAIWVWAESSPHYLKDEQFALKGSSVDSSYAAFRNARIDADTGATTSALYGVLSPDVNTHVIWGTIGGVDVSFKKVDGSGNGLAGAKFSVYTDVNCTAANIVTVTLQDGSSDTVVESAADGTVFFRVPLGLYYLKEVEAPDDYEQITTVYRLIAGSGKAAELGVTLPTGASYLIQAMDGTTALDIPDIAAYGIVNETVAKRKVVLRKIDGTDLGTLKGAKFDILRSDRTVLAENLVSDDNGVFYIGWLPYGVYYLHEKEMPGSSYDDAKCYFTLTVTEDGATVSAARTSLD
ncbi:MAG: hypothetical protein K6G17_08320 [Oscillospiraceae bacterium]|nr:hypothetical protein [Oscillospiraceae bacterium]